MCFVNKIFDDAIKFSLEKYNSTSQTKTLWMEKNSDEF